jgi:hypothetical protein
MQREYEVLEKLCQTLTPEQITHTSAITQRAVKDVLTHLVEWEQMCLGWYAAGLRGELPALPAPGYNWAQIPALNQQIYEKYRDLPLDDVLKRFRTSYQQMLQTLQGLSEDELFTPSRFAWTNKNAMATYFISATSSHYVWGQKEVRKCLKNEVVGA